MEKWLSVEEIAQILSIHPRTVRRMLTDEVIKGDKIGRQWRVREQSLHMYLESDNGRMQIQSKREQILADFANRPVTNEKDIEVLLAIKCQKAKLKDLQTKMPILLETLNAHEDLQFAMTSEDGMAQLTLNGSIELISRVVELLK